MEMFNMKKLVFALLIVSSVLLFSCEEKDKVAVNQASVNSSIEKNQESQEEEKWFMAQTDEAKVKTVTATSELVEEKFAGSYLYSPANILDGDMKTTWCEGLDGDGIGESITIEFWEPVSFDEIQIVPGFARTDNEYWINNRVKSLLITQVAEEHFQQKEYTLNDKNGWHSIKFELPQTAQTIELKITDVYAGRKYKDTCLDDFRLLYQGRVIPFKNVDSIKTEQKQVSLQMLNSGFEEKFKALFDNPCGTNSNNGKKYLVLKAVDSSDGMVLSADTRSGKFELDNMCFAYLSSSYPDYRSDEVRQIKNKNSNVKEVCFYYRDFRNTYDLGNCKIIKTSLVSYVETHTSQTVRIDGNIVNINGVRYKVLPSSTVFVYEDSDW